MRQFMLIVLLAAISGGDAATQTSRTLRTKQKIRVDSVSTWQQAQHDTMHQAGHADTLSMPHTNRP